MTENKCTSALGFSRKNPHPHDGRHVFFHPPFTLNSETAGAPLLLRISKFKDPTHPDFHEIVRYCNFNLHNV